MDRSAVRGSQAVSLFADAVQRTGWRGRWIAYVSDESGRNEIHLQAFPLSGEKHQISTSGGSEAYWRKDGTELFYLAADRNLMAVPIKPGATAGGDGRRPALLSQQAGRRNASHHRGAQLGSGVEKIIA